MPGVRILTDTAPGTSQEGGAPGATYFVTGITERGPIDRPVLIRSLAEYEYHFGPRVTYGALHDDLASYFGEGGGRAYVGRVVGPAATEASRVLLDRAGAPLNTLRIDAIDPGAWGLGITYEVRNGVAANTFDLILRYGDETETYEGLTSPQDAADKVNGASRWVTLTNLGSVTAAPLNNPAVIAAIALNVGGTDDRAAVVAATYVTAADALFPRSLGAGAIAVPGQASSAVGALLIGHAADTEREALLTTAIAQSNAQAQAASDAIKGAGGGQDRGGLFWPWVKIPAGGGATRTVAPSGYVAAARARAHEASGPQRPGAGAISHARYVVDVETAVTSDQGDALDAANVNVIRRIAGGIRVYGWRSLSTDRANWYWLTYRAVLNDIVHAGYEALEDYVLRDIDSSNHLFRNLHGDLVGIVQPMATAGALYAMRHAETGDELDPGWSVDTGAEVNTPQTIGAGQIRAAIGARPSPVGDLVILTVSKAAFAAPL